MNSSSVKSWETLRSETEEEEEDEEYLSPYIRVELPNAHLFELWVPPVYCSDMDLVTSVPYMEHPRQKHVDRREVDPKQQIQEQREWSKEWSGLTAEQMARTCSLTFDQLSEDLPNIITCVSCRTAIKNVLQRLREPDEHELVAEFDYFIDYEQIYPIAVHAPRVGESSQILTMHTSFPLKSLNTFRLLERHHYEERQKSSRNHNIRCSFHRVNKVKLDSAWVHLWDRLGHEKRKCMSEIDRWDFERRLERYVNCEHCYPYVYGAFCLLGGIEDHDGYRWKESNLEETDFRYDLTGHDGSAVQLPTDTKHVAEMMKLAEGIVLQKEKGGHTTDWQGCVQRVKQAFGLALWDQFESVCSKIRLEEHALSLFVRVCLCKFRQQTKRLSQEVKAKQALSELESLMEDEQKRKLKKEKKRKRKREKRLQRQNSGKSEEDSPRPCPKATQGCDLARKPQMEEQLPPPLPCPKAMKESSESSKQNEHCSKDERRSRSHSHSPRIRRLRGGERKPGTDPPRQSTDANSEVGWTGSAKKRRKRRERLRKRKRPPGGACDDVDDSPCSHSHSPDSTPSPPPVHTSSASGVELSQRRKPSQPERPSRHTPRVKIPKPPLPQGRLKRSLEGRLGPQSIFASRVGRSSKQPHDTKQMAECRRSSRPGPIDAVTLRDPSENPNPRDDDIIYVPFSRAELRLLESLGWSMENREKFEADPLKNHKPINWETRERARKKIQHNFLQFCSCGSRLGTEALENLKSSHVT